MRTIGSHFRRVGGCGICKENCNEILTVLQKLMLMLLWIIGGLTSVFGTATHSEAERIGRDIGATIGVSMILGLWVMGDIILGIVLLLTRGDKVIVEEMVGNGPSSSASWLGDESDKDWTRNADQIIARYAQESAQRSPITVDPGTRQTSSACFGRRRFS
jgi:hypothetical protein